MRRLMICAAMAGSLLFSCSALANLITTNNPGFEQSINTTWTSGCDTTNWFGWGNVESVTWSNYNGAQSLVFKGWMGGAGAVETKTAVTPDTAYEATFYQTWDGSYAASTPQLMFIWVDSGGQNLSTSAFDLVISGSQANWNQAGVFSATSPASASSVEIQFNMGTMTAGGAYYIDDVSFAAAVPEPTTMFLTTVGVVGLFMGRRKWMRK